MKISSPAFEKGGGIPVAYSAEGVNVNPELVVEGILPGVKSLVLIVEDPDAQKVCGFTWIHWVVFNIPVDSGLVVIEENSMPGVPGDSSYKSELYGGPNPPRGSGVHHYFFRIFALDKMLDLDEMAFFVDIKREMKGHVLDSCELVGTYSRG